MPEVLISTKGPNSCCSAILVPTDNFECISTEMRNCNNHQMITSLPHQWLLQWINVNRSFVWCSWPRAWWIRWMKTVVAPSGAWVFCAVSLWRELLVCGPVSIYRKWEEVMVINSNQLASFHFRITPVDSERRHASCLRDGRNWTHAVGSKLD